jgi:phage N-6-adenine-methyltransferase
MTFHETGDTSYGAGGDENDTPASFVEPFHRLVGPFDLDPCASGSSNLASRNVTKEEDGLARDWAGTVWMNPPYSEVETWLEYATRQQTAGNTDMIIGLTYARTDTQWFHNRALAADMLCLIEGRLSFGDNRHSAPAPSMVLVWGDSGPDLREHLTRIGIAVETAGGPEAINQTVTEFL